MRRKFKKAHENNGYDIYLGAYFYELGKYLRFELRHAKDENLKMKLLKFIKKGDYSDFRVIFMLRILNWLNVTETNDLIQNSHYLENLMKFIQEINGKNEEAIQDVIILFIENLYKILDKILDIDENMFLNVYKHLSMKNKKLTTNIWRWKRTTRRIWMR